MAKKAKIRTVVFLDPELAFLKDIKGASRLVNLILKKVFGDLPGEVEKIAAALEIMRGERTLDVGFRGRNQCDGPKKTFVTESKPPSRPKGTSNLLAELSKKAKEFE